MLTLTLSLYLKGGERTFRNHKPHLKGQAGKLCLMPQGHLSHWHSPKPIRIAHLYLPSQIIRQEAERHLLLGAITRTDPNRQETLGGIRIRTLPKQSQGDSIQSYPLQGQAIQP